MSLLVVAAVLDGFLKVKAMGGAYSLNGEDMYSEVEFSSCDCDAFAIRRPRKFVIRANELILVCEFCRSCVPDYHRR